MHGVKTHRKAASLENFSTIRKLCNEQKLFKLSLKRSEITERAKGERCVSAKTCKTEARNEKPHQAEAKWRKANDQGQKLYLFCSERPRMQTPKL